MKVFYSIAELSKILKISRHRTKALVLGLGVPMQLVGNRYLVFYSDISLYAPVLIASIIECEALNGDDE